MIRMPSLCLKYVVITPARDEAENLPRLAEALTSQTALPTRWFIVNDGSTDGTPAIAQRLKEHFSWIDVIHLPDRGKRQRGPGVVRAFYAAYDKASALPHDVVAKVDADVSFSSDIFEQLLVRLTKEPRLGICGGGIVIEQTNGEWKPDRILPDTFVRGPMKVYRRSCFDSIGGLVPYKGWDGIDDIKAMTQGWIVRRFDDLPAKHHRFVGEATGALRSSFENGFGGRYMGSLFLYNLFEAFQFMRRPPYVVRGLAMVTGYAWAALIGHRIRDKNVVNYIRAEQRLLLRERFAGWPKVWFRPTARDKHDETS